MLYINSCVYALEYNLKPKRLFILDNDPYVLNINPSK